MIDKIKIDKLKSETKIGDKFGVYYHGTTFKNFTEVVRFNDKSVWLKTSWNTDKGKISNVSRESWNTVLQYINKNTYQKV